MACILLAVLTVLSIIPAAASADEALLLGFPVADVAVVSMGGKIYPVRLMGIAVPGSSSFKYMPAANGSMEQLIKFLEKTVHTGENIRLEFGAKREDALLGGYLAAYVWLQDGRMLNEEIIKAGLGVAVNEGKYVERLAATANHHDR